VHHDAVYVLIKGGGGSKGTESSIFLRRGSPFSESFELSEVGSLSADKKEVASLG
jgi:hypothetical protein